MLTEKRYEMILNLLKEKQSITITEITETLKVSESTARRDLYTLAEQNKLVKVFGGAVALPEEKHYTAVELSVGQKSHVNVEQKKKIAKYAASLIQPRDFVYLDAGTTTGYMISYLREKTAVYVTNGVDHAKYLAAAGFHVFLIGGELKSSTEAVIGTTAVLNLQGYHFTKGFFGVNGVTIKEGFTTPDPNEALVKETAMKACEEAYVLCDSGKFGAVTPVTFGTADDAVILTETEPSGEYKEWEKKRRLLVVE